MTSRDPKDCPQPQELVQVVLMHDETNPHEHREHTRILKALTWDHIQLLNEVMEERSTASEAKQHISKGVQLWATVTFLTLLMGAVLVAVKDWILKVLHA